MAGTIRFAFSKLMQDVNGMLPAEVIAFNRITNRVQVKLMIKVLTTDGSIISRSQIASLPVLQIGGGGFIANFNLNSGDLGWVLANDRDISLFLNTYTESAPNTLRKNNFSDGLFIPHVMTNYSISEEDTNNFVLQKLDGSVKISLSNNTIKISAPNVEIDGATTVTGVLNAQGGINISGGSTPIAVTGDLRVIGNITASGSITPNVP